MLYLLSLSPVRRLGLKVLEISAEEAVENQYLWGFGGLFRESFMLIYALLLRELKSDNIPWKYCIQVLVLFL